MTGIVAETREEAAAREALLDLCMPDRDQKASERLREGRLPAEGLSLVAHGPDGRLVGTVRLWHVSAGPARPALLLGPLAVHPWFRERGLGGALMRAALGEAAARGHGAVLLVGDPEYYERFGFSAAQTGDLWMPGPFARRRLLALELVPGALEAVPSLDDLIARAGDGGMKQSA